MYLKFSQVCSKHRSKESKWGQDLNLKRSFNGFFKGYTLAQQSGKLSVKKLSKFSKVA